MKNFVRVVEFQRWVFKGLTSKGSWVCVVAFVDENGVCQVGQYKGLVLPGKKGDNIKITYHFTAKGNLIITEIVPNVPEWLAPGLHIGDWVVENQDGIDGFITRYPTKWAALRQAKHDFRNLPKHKKGLESFTVGKLDMDSEGAPYIPFPVWSSK